MDRGGLLSCHRWRLLKGFARGVGLGSCLWLLLFPALPLAASGGGSGSRKAGDSHRGRAGARAHHLAT